jgi:hypothetical protein
MNINSIGTISRRAFLALQGVRVPLADVYDLLQVGDRIRTNADNGSITEGAIIDGVIGEIREEPVRSRRIYVWQNEISGSVGSISPTTFGFTNSWGIEMPSGSIARRHAWVEFFGVFTPPPKKKVIPWKDKSLPKKGIEFKMTPEVSQWYLTYCDRWGIKPDLDKVEPMMKLIASDRHIESFRVDGPVLHILTRPGLVQNETEAKKCGRTPGWDIQLGVVQVQGEVTYDSDGDPQYDTEERIMNIVCRDGILPTHPNVSNDGRMCFGDWVDADTIYRGDFATTVQVALMILYGPGKNGFSYWPQFFGARPGSAVIPPAHISDASGTMLTAAYVDQMVDAMQRRVIITPPMRTRTVRRIDINPDNFSTYTGDSTV